MRTRRTITAALALTLTLGGAAVPAAAVAGTSASPADADRLVQQLEQLVAGSERRELLDRRLGIDPAQRTQALGRAIDGSQYECTDTALSRWLDEQLVDWTPTDLFILSSLGVLDWPTYDALLTQPDGPQSFGTTGQHTQQMTKTMRTLRGFWDVDGSDIQLAAMHSEVVLDDARMVPLVVFLFEVDQAQAQQIVDLVQDYLAAERFDHGRHPLLSFNAFAYTEAGAPADQTLGVPDMIVMGDGILTGMAAVGLGDVAPRGILAHEYGHHVQFELGLFDDHAGDAEATRTTELEADALAGYYLSHPRGERLRSQRVDAFVRSFGEVGDCAFDNPGHHGTPAQRSTAAAWASDLADAKGPKGHILSARTVSDRFRAVLDRIVAPSS